MNQTLESDHLMIRYMNANDPRSVCQERAVEVFLKLVR